MTCGKKPLIGSREMRQVLLANNSIKVARMPAPSVEDGMVLVRVEFSMISMGTELAGIRRTQEVESGSAIDQAREIGTVAGRYLRKAVLNPRRAASRLKRIAEQRISRILPAKEPERRPDLTVANLTWVRDNATELDASGETLQIASDESDWQYQAHTGAFGLEPGYQVAVDLRGSIECGKMAIGILDETGSKWLGNRTLLPGALDDRLVFDCHGASGAILVISNAQGGLTKANFSMIGVTLIPPDPAGIPHNEMDETGWNLGYSASGVVVAVGGGVHDFQPGDRVACSGAGRANHADYILVPRNLTCRAPAGCDIRWAATTTIGTIAMQGVRRAQPTLGEWICVIGLGLLGQITVQLLRAAGCRVIGIDPDQMRVDRAKSLGLEAGTSNPETLHRLVRDLTQGQGVDRTLITAATKSDAVINMAMEVTRRRGSVIIVGDVGLHLERASFYRKEIDLLMSTSYGPGRYDSRYEEGGVDYPFAYVRWTLNRNMQSYMELIASGRLNIEALVDVIAPVDQAADVYNRLATSKIAPIGVLLEYSGSAAHHTEPLEATSVRLQGARTAQSGKINYVLVGAGAYGQSMLVPMMDKRQDCFFLRGVVSRDSVRGGNFVRERRLEVFSSNLDSVLADPNTHMVVIATRHCDHARQTKAALRAGKHVFVEKPLAVTWQELDEIVTCYEQLESKPLLMVGFNRRFSPAVQTLKSVLAQRTSPLVINYRLNGGYIPLDHWIQTEQGGGRNIGEACHMYDVFRALSGKPAVSISATSINPSGHPYLPTDNFAATVAYEDGSIGNLVYTAMGPKKGLPKERIEVFCDGEAYVVDDFKSLIKASTGEVLWSATEADKGQSNQMSLIADALMKGLDAPLGLEEILETTAVSLYIEDQLLGRVSPND